MSSLPVSDTISNRIWLKNTAGNFRQCFFMFICHRQLFRRSSCATVRSCPCFFQIYSDFTSASFHLQLFPSLLTFQHFPVRSLFLTLSCRYPLQLCHCGIPIHPCHSYSTLSLPCLTRQSPPCMITVTVKEAPMEQISTRYFKIFYTKLPHYVESENNLKYSTPDAACFDICEIGRAHV